MRDLVLYAHIILGLATIAFPLIILLNLKRKELWLKVLAIAAPAAAWILLIPAGKLYLTFYPATKTLILAGQSTWLHAVLMETKEHWGLLLPIIATTAAWLFLTGKRNESKKWWALTMILSIFLGVMGSTITGGAS